MNKISKHNKQWEELKNGKKSSDSFSESEEEFNDSNLSFKNESLDYLPNELKFTAEYKNEESELILEGPANSNKGMITQFFRGITLCH